MKGFLKFFLTMFFLIGNHASACPLVPFDGTSSIINPHSSQATKCKKKFLDFNCDQKLNIIFIGDSIVYGVGDSVNKGKGGYVLRIQKKFPRFSLDKVRITALGYPGITTQKLLAQIKQIYKNRKKRPFKRTFKRLSEADIIVIDVSRNDFWNNKPVEYSFNNIKRLVSFLQNNLPKLHDKDLVFISTSSLIPTSRSFQIPFIEELNKKLLKYPYTRIKQKLNVNLLNSDGLHPSSMGYTSVADNIFSQLTNQKKFKVEMELLRPDSDGDGIPNLFEAHRYNTHYNFKDSDNDGLSDFDELFIYQTDPLYGDTDGDGISDGDEVHNGTDPLDDKDPVVTPTPTNTPVHTETPTEIPTETPTDVPTETPTPTPTPTSTFTSIPTSAPTDTPLPISTPIDTPAPTNTPAG